MGVGESSVLISALWGQEGEGPKSSFPPKTSGCTWVKDNNLGSPGDWDAGSEGQVALGLNPLAEQLRGLEWGRQGRMIELMPYTPRLCTHHPSIPHPALQAAL